MVTDEMVEAALTAYWDTPMEARMEVVKMRAALEAADKARCMPSDSIGTIELVGSGMSLRDWFAGRALGACPPFSETGEIGSAEDAARFAYEVADAMIRARGEQP